MRRRLVRQWVYPSPSRSRVALLSSSEKAGRRVEVAVDVDSVDAGPDVGSELHYTQSGHPVTIGDGVWQHHGCAHYERKAFEGQSMRMT